MTTRDGAHHPLRREMIEFEPGTIRPGQVVVVVTGPGTEESTAVRIASWHAP